jgi:hypothetical protein
MKLILRQPEKKEEKQSTGKLSIRWDLEEPKIALTPPNNFLRVDVEFRDPPERVYARVDSVEQVGPNDRERLALLEAVDAGWFNERSTNPEPLDDDEFRAMPISVLAVMIDTTGHQRSRPRELRRWMIGDWLEVEFGAEPGRMPVHLFHGLFADPTEMHATFGRPDAQLKEKLEDAFSLDRIPDASIEKIEHILGKGDGVACLNVFDVGQGNAIGFSRRKKTPTLYFDFGGGVLSNKRTFPRVSPINCLTAAPAIVLSHWDWDHWSSGMRVPNAALDCDWLVPRQKLGGVHRTFANELIKRGRLHVWPISLPALSVGQITVERCTGRDQNNSGLAMIVATPRRAKKRGKVLLPGDADYCSIPSANNGPPFSGIVASHHGSRLTSIAMAAAPKSGGTLVYSYGSGNTFGHPRLQSQLEYLQAGWKPGNTWSTTQSVMRRPSNIGISLTTERPRLHCLNCSPRYTTQI